MSMKLNFKNTLFDITLKPTENKIGLKENDLGADNEEMWLGLNLLGKTLTKLRDDIIRDKESV